MKSERADNSVRSGKAWLWKTALLAAGAGIGAWLLLSVLVPQRLPEGFPEPPDLGSQGTPLSRLVRGADSQARKHPVSSEDVGRLGMIYHSNQYYPQAESAYRIAARLAPDNYRWPYLLALLAEETGREKEVMIHLQRALQLKPDYVPALQKAADIYYKQDKLEEAASHYGLAAGSAGKESSLQPLFGLARVAARRNDWKKVVELVAPLSREYPQIRPLHQLLLDAYETLGLDNKAGEERSDLLEPTLIVVPLLKDPLSTELLSLSCSSTRLLKEAGLMSRFRRPDDAIQVARRAVEVGPGDADAHHFLARTLLEAHGASPEAVDEALSHLNEGLRLRPDDLMPLWYFATFFFKQGKTDAAVERLRAMLASNAKSAESHYYLGMTAEHQGRTEEAVAQYQEALRGDPNYAEPCHRLGLILITQGKLNEATAYFQKAVHLKPTFVMARSNLGVALDQQGKTGEAIAQFEEALRQNANDATTHQFLAIALTKSGRFEGAALHFRETIRLAPDNAEAYYGLGCVLAMQRKSTEAAEVFQHVLKLRPDHAEARNRLQELERRKP